MTRTLVFGATRINPETPSLELAEPQIDHINYTRGKLMKTQRFLIALTILNLALLLAQLIHVRPTLAQSNAPILRGRALEIVDDQGRVRASISVLPAKQMANKETFPETVILRLIDSKGKPSVKLAATEQGSVLGLLGDSEPTYARIEATGASTFVKLTNKDGHEQIVKP